MVNHVGFYIKVNFADSLSKNQTIRESHVDEKNMLETKTEYEYIKPRFMETRNF